MDQLDHLLNAEDLAAYLNVPVTTLYAWRCRYEALPASALASTSATERPTSANGSASDSSKRSTRAVGELPPYLPVAWSCEVGLDGHGLSVRWNAWVPRDVAAVCLEGPAVRGDLIRRGL